MELDSLFQKFHSKSTKISEPKNFEFEFFFQNQPRKSPGAKKKIPKLPSGHQDIQLIKFKL